MCLQNKQEMLLPCLSNIYKNLARGTTLYVCSQCYPCSADLLLQHVFLPRKTRNSSSGAVNAPPSAAVPTTSSCSPTVSVSRTLPSQVPLPWDTPSALTDLMHCAVLPTSWASLFSYRELSPKLKLLIGEYITTCCSLSEQKACGKTSCLRSDHTTCSIQLWVDMLSYMPELL